VRPLAIENSPPLLLCALFCVVTTRLRVRARVSAEAHIDKAEKKSWHPIMWPHPELIQTEMLMTQNVRFLVWAFGAVESESDRARAVRN
jgi:hypothetical protein